jgi:endonuclease YncB( thermonuclease family)
MPDLGSARVVDLSRGSRSAEAATRLDRGEHRRKIRASGIDAPKKGQASGDRAKQRHARLVPDDGAGTYVHSQPQPRW